MKKILFILFALAVCLQSVSAQSLGQDDQTDAAGLDGLAANEVAPSLRVFPFQWVDLTDPSKEAKAFVPELLEIFYSDSSDEAVDNVNMDMTIKYFGEKYTTLSIVLNGFIAFDQKAIGTLVGSNSYSPAGIPNPQLPNNLVAPLWVDLTFRGSDGYSFYRTFKPEKGDKSYDHMVIQWEDGDLSNGYFFFYTFSNNYSVSLTFQVILFSEGGILFQYKTIDSSELRAELKIEQDYGIISSTVDLDKLTDFEIMKSKDAGKVPISIGYENKTGLKGTSWDFSVATGSALGNELVPEWASGSASGNFLDLIDGRDRRNNAVTGGSGSSGGSCFIGKKKASLDR